VGGRDVDHPEAGAPVRSTRLWAAVAVAITIGGAVVAGRAGPREHAPATAGAARSSTWICPHGGGRDWTGAVIIANPGTEPLQARIRGLAPDGASAARGFDVPPASQVIRDVPATVRGSATVVEVFGGWAGVGWQVRAGGEERGLGVEPCAASAGEAWYVAGMPTLEGERSFLIVANPFAVVAIVDVALFSPDAPPVRDPDLTDLAVAPGGSVALPVSGVLPGKASAAAAVTASTGRVALGALTVTDAGGVRSILGSSVTSTSWSLPMGAGANQATLSIGVIDDAAVRFSAVLRTDESPRPAGGLVNIRQAGTSASLYPVATTSASSVDVLAVAPVVAALSAEGQGMDDAATGGAVAPAPDWLVISTVQEEPRFPGVVVVNPSDTAVEVVASTVGTGEAQASASSTITVGPGRAAHLPAAFLARDPTASVLVRASGPVVVVGASTSSGSEGVAQYALAIGLPVPAWSLP
jgi:hypothetical protein